MISSQKYIEKYTDLSESKNFTIVYEDEMVTNSSEFDPTLEEALHLVSRFGFALEYPSEFGESKGSKISLLMDQARGGYFKTVPSSYPQRAIYTYYDKTCDYSCQITEFTYWTITSLRNQQSGSKRFNEIKDEWQLNTRKKIERNFPKLLSFFSNPAFGIIF